MLLRAQYSAASFIETVNATSLTIDPDEFMARMVAAGIPDMQLAPNPHTPPAPLLRGKSSASMAAAAAAPPILAPSATDALPQKIVAAAAPMHAEAAVSPGAAAAAMPSPAALSSGLPPVKEGLPASPLPMLTPLPESEVGYLMPCSWACIVR
jgi:hypothetical protein